MPYSYEFTSNAAYRFASGALFLGTDPKEGYEVGIQTERHAITIAGSRAGKGAALMIPNLLRWPHNALVIDPKGEAAEETAEARAAMGQDVRILAPFGDHPAYRLPAKLDRFRAKLNPLQNIRADDPAAREEINAVADGLVMRADSKAAHWDNGGLSVIAGVIAYVLGRHSPEKRTLPAVRRLLTLPDEQFENVIKEMATVEGFGNLAAAGSTRLTRSGGEAAHFLSVADEATKWLDSPLLADLLSASTFHLSDLKTKPCTVYLVLPPDQLGEHGRFLRLFARMALKAMVQGGKEGRRCLFMLDEFFSLGYIDEIAKAAGQLPGYGVTLWPFLQDLGQLETLYGRDGAQTFFGNADAQIFFGNTDGRTLDYVSGQIGRVSPEEMPPPPGKLPFNDKGGFFATLDDNAMREHRYETAGLGSPRLPPDQVRETVTKGGGDKVARSMIVLAFGRDVLNVRLAPYFAPPPAPPGTPAAKLSELQAMIHRATNSNAIYLRYSCLYFSISYQCYRIGDCC